MKLRQAIHEVNQTRTNVPETDTTLDLADSAYSELKSRYPKIYKYIKYECPVPIDPVQSLAAVRSSNEDHFLQMLKRYIKSDTQQMYGDDYPVKENTRKR